LEPAAYAFGALDEFFHVGQLALRKRLELFVCWLVGVARFQ
jgi:hypothetical protein